MKVVIPLAGKGTRMRPHTYITPKPLLKVADKPVMSYILDDLETLGVEEIVFITGYLKEKIEEYIRAEYPGFRAHFVEQPVQNGTAGAVQLAEPYIDEDVLIIFVDTLFEADLGMIRSLPEGEAGIIWVKEVEDYKRFGVVVTDAQGYMKRIIEKPRDPISKLANIGLYYIRDSKLLFEGIRHTMGGPKGPGEEYYLTDAFQYMIDRGAKLRTAEVRGWYDCGKPETLIATNRHLLEAGRARKPVGGGDTRVESPVRVAEGVVLDDVVLGPNVTIGTGCKLRGVRIRDSIVGSDTTIENAVLHDSLIGDRVRIRGVKGALNVADDSEVLGD
ncbi:MAG TPA: sugar phosphate nucleotidyltransferase [Longimicrobiales bacterium]